MVSASEARVKYLCPDVSQKVLNVFPNEGVLHDGLSVYLQEKNIIVCTYC